MEMLVFSDIFQQDSHSVLLLSHSQYSWKNSDEISDVLWIRLSSKHLTVAEHDRFFDIAIKFQERWNFPNDISCLGGANINIKCLPKTGSLF